MDKKRIISALEDPKVWGAIFTILSLLGVSFLKTVDTTTLIGAIVIVVSAFATATGYENGKKAEAQANIQTAQMHVEAAQATERAMIQSSAAPLIK